MTGTSVSRGLASAIALRSRSRAAVMNGVWNAPDTCSGITFLAPSSLATIPAAVHTLRRAGDDDLARRIEVGDPHIAVGAPAGNLDLVVVEPEHRCHGAGVLDSGLMHGVCAFDDQTHTLVEAQCARCRQRGVLAEAVARAEARLETETFCRVEHHQARHERRQLRVAGVAQLVGVGIEQEVADIAFGNVGRLVDELPAFVFDPWPAHTRSL